MRKLVCIILFAAFAWQVNAQSEAQSAIKEIVSYAERIEQLSCDFVMTKQSKMFNEASDSYGHMQFNKPDKIILENTAPVRSVMTIEGEKIQLTDESGTRNMAAGSGMAKGIRSLLLGSISGENLSDTKTFTISVEENATEWVVTLIPRRQQMKQMLSGIVINFDKTLRTANSITLSEASGDTSKISFSNVKVILK